MLPSTDQLMFCIMQDGEIVDGAHGLAIGDTELGAWKRALDPCTFEEIEKYRQSGAGVRRCAIMVINP